MGAANGVIDAWVKAECGFGQLKNVGEQVTNIFQLGSVPDVSTQNYDTCVAERTATYQLYFWLAVGLVIGLSILALSCYCLLGGCCSRICCCCCRSGSSTKKRHSNGDD